MAAPASAPLSRDPYEVLGISRSATAAELKRAYRRLAHRHHPDKNPGDLLAAERFRELSVAYELLADRERRAAYDRAQASPFAEVFAATGRNTARAARERGRDRELELVIDLPTALCGAERLLEVGRPVKCITCTGTGARPGSVPQLCHACGGTGSVRVQQGLGVAARRCSYCQGRGRLVRDACKTCAGVGTVDKPHQVRVRIPPGAEDGGVLRYDGEGEPGHGGGPPGDLRVKLRVTAHEVWGRDGADVLLDLPISVSEAALGASLEVPTLDGRVRMKLPAGTQSGHVFRLRGKGAPIPGTSERGDQRVTVVIETPQALTAEQSELLRRFGVLERDENRPRRAALWAKLGADEKER